MREFFDEDHPLIMEDFDSILDIESIVDADALISQLNCLINKDPGYFDTYVYLHNIYLDFEEYEKAEDVLIKGYERALALILDENGNWPDKLSWIYIRNRHVIRIFEAMGIWYWRHEKNKEALSLFRKLLLSNPIDNNGIRFYILAIRMNMNYETFDKRFRNNRNNEEDIFEWFKKEYGRFMGEFTCFNSITIH